MKKNLMLQSAIFILFVLLARLHAQSEATGSINSYWLTDRILIVGYGEMEMDMVAAVNTEKGIVIIDSGISPSVTTMHKSIIEKEFGRSDFKYVINTHHHGDHTYGNQVFNDAVIIAHENAVKWMQEVSTEEEIASDVKRTRETIERRKLVLKTLEKDSVPYKKLKDRIYVTEKMCDDYETIFQMTPPNLTFTEYLSLDMGDLNIELVYFGPDFHSDNDIIISIPEENVIFMGDLMHKTNQYQSVKSNSDIEHWITSLDKILINNNDIKHVVAYHVGILPGESFRDLHESLKVFQIEQIQKKSAVDSLRIMISASNVQEAVNQFEDQFIKNNNEDYFIWEGDLLSLSAEYKEKERYDEAIMILNIHEKIFTKSTMALYSLGGIYTKEGKYHLAIEAYKKMLKIDPTNYFYAELIYQLENIK